MDSAGNIPEEGMEDLLKEYQIHAGPREIVNSDSVGALFGILAELKTFHYFELQ